MLKFAHALLALTAFHLLLLLSILYWFLFDNSAPPFIQGRPVENAVISLSLISIFTGFFGAMLRDFGMSE